MGTTEKQHFLHFSWKVMPPVLKSTIWGNVFRSYTNQEKIEEIMRGATKHTQWSHMVVCLFTRRDGPQEGKEGTYMQEDVTLYNYCTPYVLYH